MMHPDLARQKQTNVEVRLSITITIHGDPRKRHYDDLAQSGGTVLRVGVIDFSQELTG